jgi:hypothetical protein
MRSRTLRTTARPQWRGPRHSREVTKPIDGTAGGDRLPAVLPGTTERGPGEDARSEPLPTHLSARLKTISSTPGPALNSVGRLTPVPAAFARQNVSLFPSIL